MSDILIPLFISDIMKLDSLQKNDCIEKEEAVCMKKRRKWRWKRAAACLLTAAMLLTMPGVSAFADETDASVINTGGCEHHLEHTEDCGYTEEEVGAPCEHEHREAC